MSSRSFKNHLRRDSLERSGLNAQKGRKCDPLEPSQEGSLSRDSTVFTFPLLPKSIQTCGQKLSKWRPDALKNLSGEGLKKTFKTCVIFCRLWGSNVVQN